MVEWALPEHLHTFLDTLIAKKFRRIVKGEDVVFSGALVIAKCVEQIGKLSGSIAKDEDSISKPSGSIVKNEDSISKPSGLIVKDEDSIAKPFGLIAMPSLSIVKGEPAIASVDAVIYSGLADRQADLLRDTAA